MNIGKKAVLSMMNKGSDAMREGDWCSSMSNNWSSMNCMDCSWNNWSMNCMSNSRGMMSNNRSMMGSMMSNNRSYMSSMMGNDWSVMGSMSYNWSSMNSMVSYSWSSMNSMRNMGSMRMGNRRRDRGMVSHRVDSMVGHWGREGFTVLINRNRLGKEGVEERISIESIQLGSSIAVNLRNEIICY